MQLIRFCEGSLYFYRFLSEIYSFLGVGDFLKSFGILRDFELIFFKAPRVVENIKSIAHSIRKN